MTLLLKKRTLSRAKMLDLLKGLDDSDGNDSLTLYLPPGLPAAERDNALNGLAATPDILTGLAELAGSSGTGSVVFWSPAVKYLAVPPFPFSEKHVAQSLYTERLQSLIGRDYLIALVLVRLGSFAIGVCRGEKLVNSKVGTGLVHGRHKKGGSSAHRFERHRDKQIEYFLTRVCQHAREQLEIHLKSLDYVVYGGARTTLQLLRKQCPFICKLNTPALPSLFDIPEPRQPVLETAVSRAWSSTVYEWVEG